MRFAKNMSVSIARHTTKVVKALEDRNLWATIVRFAGKRTELC